ncbi:MAG TPA: BF3164 family lipoprotein [Edaphocola sp.]|nr:BF3164 family lipoprotein [Edaphocola sp.]
MTIVYKSSKLIKNINITNLFPYKYGKLWIVQVLLTSVLLLNSCTSTDRTSTSRGVDDIEVIEINIKGHFEEIKASEIFEPDFEVIKLETTDKSIFSVISDIQITDDLIFICDVTTNRLFVFYRNGQFKKGLTQTGRGPGEFITASSFCINEKDSLIFLYDNMQMKLLTYDFELNFIKESPVPFYAMKIGYINSNYLAFFTGQMKSQDKDYQYELIVVNENMEIIEKLLPYPGFFNAIRGIATAPLANYDGSYLYWNSFDNSVYQLDQNHNLSEKYRILNYKGFVFPDYNFYLERNNLASGQVADEIWEKGYIYSQEFLENKNNILMVYHQDGNHYTVINKKNMTQYHAKRLQDDFGLGLNLTKRSKPIYMENKNCIYAIYYQDFEYINDTKTTPNHIFENFSINDNPILVVLKLKKNPIELN